MVRFVAFGLGLSALISVTGACSSTTDASTSSGLAPKPVCPTFVENAVDPATKCTSEGYVCGIGYQCGVFQQQATCTCTGGHYACVAPDGKGGTVDIPSGTVRADVSANFCIAQPPSAEACPMDVSSEGKQCQTAGKACYYANSLCKTVPLTDVCTCEGVPGTAKDGGATNKLTWVCTLCN